MNESIVKVRTPETVGAEIRNLTSAARYLNVYYAVEIGRRLTEAKELVPHGEWLSFLKNETEFSQPTANRFMRVFAEYGSEQGSLFGAETKYSTLNNLSVSNALRLLAVPEEERESFALEVDAEHLTTKELEDAIRERDEAKAALQELKEEMAETSEMLDKKTDEYAALSAAAREYKENAEAAEARVKELEERPIEVAVQEPDPEEVERRVKEATVALRAEKQMAEEKLAKEKERAKAATDKLREQLKDAEDRITKAGAEDRAAAEAAKAEVDRLQKQIAMSGEAMVAFKLRFKEWQDSYAALQRSIRDLDEDQAERANAAIQAQIGQWTNS